MAEAQVQELGDLVGSIERVAGSVGDIGAAAREQAAGVGIVSKALEELDKVTQQNAALVEQSTAAAESLKSQAQVLRQIVGSFQLDATAAARG